MTPRDAGDPFDLQRFVDAQDAGATYDAALAELRAGRKTSHWMWFVLPQVSGLGLSATSRRYAISGLDEARAFLAHPVLGPRLRACCQVVAATPTGDAEDLLGGIDAQKLASSMTLFTLAEPGEPVFRSVLARFFDGRLDPATQSRV